MNNILKYIKKEYINFNIFSYISTYFCLIIIKKIIKYIQNGDWGLGIGDWGFGPIPKPQSPIPNPQSPIN